MRFAILLSIFSVYHTAFSQENPRIEVVAITHTLNNVSVSHFPNYFINKQFESYVMNETARKLVAKYQAAEVMLPASVRVNRSDRYGRIRHEIPINMISDFDLYVSIMSVIQKDLNSLNKRWLFDIVIQKGEEVVFTKRVEHQLEPYAISGYLTQVRWLSQQEFANFFLTAVDELLETIPARSSPIKLGNDQYVNNLIETSIPGFNTSLLSVNGSYITGGNVSLSVDGKSERIASIEYTNRGWRARPREAVSNKSKEVLQKVMGSTISGALNRNFVRNGIAQTNTGEELQIRYDKITIGNSALTAMSAPDFIQVAKSDSITGHMFFFSTPSGENVLFGGYRDEGSFGWGDKHFLQGELDGKFYVVEFDEQLGLIYFMTETETEAILLLQNLNSASSVFGGLMLSANNRRILLKSYANTSVDAPDAEWYALFTHPDIGQESLAVYGKLFLMLFFALAAN
ncbi:MAG TPA: hypothetical protein PKC24_00375 [Cyclobacteriaceae bacterium]|nr:hypothetical protein [Cyclobacteriaceae bacterium]